MNTVKLDLEEILDAIMFEEPEPTYEALERWTVRYPEHCDALADFFAAWAIQAELPEGTAVDEERLANRAVSYALDIVHRQNEAAKRVPEAKLARPRLIAAARDAGLSESELAARTGLDETMLVKLDLRRVSGIPRLCYERIAAALGSLVERIEEMITGPPLVASGVRRKAKQKPKPVTEDFANAIRNSSLPEDAKRFWLEAAAAERHSSKQ